MRKNIKKISSIFIAGMILFTQIPLKFQATVLEKDGGSVGKYSDEDFEQIKNKLYQDGVVLNTSYRPDKVVKFKK